MKKIITVFLLFFINFLSPLIAEDLEIIEAKKEGFDIIFMLKYKNVHGRNKYFEKDVKSALILENLVVNGEPVIPEYDYTLYYALVDDYKTKYISSKEQDIFIEMTWKKYENKNWAFPYRGNLYILAPGTEVTVLYRVIYPFPFGNAERLLQRKFNEKYISPIYTAKLVLPSMEVEH